MKIRKLIVAGASVLTIVATAVPAFGMFTATVTASSVAAAAPSHGQANPATSEEQA